MIVKVIVVILLLFIVYSLGSALYFLVNEKKEASTHVVRSLSWRIGLSIILLGLLFLSYWMGWIAPHQL